MTLGCSAVAAGVAKALVPRNAAAETVRPRFADMHTHVGARREVALREQMLKYGMLIVADNVVPDNSVTQHEKRGIRTFREARLGELRRNFDVNFARRREKYRQEQLPMITSVETLERVLAERVPAVVSVAEGADFLEGDIAYLDKVRAAGLCHLQLLHYYSYSGIGDISTEEPAHGGLTAFGKDLIRACNRLGILVDIAHATSAGIEQALELSTKPVIYSHGHVSASAPHPSKGARLARAIHAPLAKQVAAQGGVIGIWPLWASYASLDLYCDELARLAQAYGAAHVGIGSDMFGLTRTIMPSYEEFSALPAYLEKRGMKEAAIEAVLGGNYIRVLKQALTI
jgi:membrane dipeptidase